MIVNSLIAFSPNNHGKINSIYLFIYVKSYLSIYLIVYSYSVSLSTYHSQYTNLSLSLSLSLCIYIYISWINSFPSLRPVAEPRLKSPVYHNIYPGRIVGFILFQRVLTLSEMWTSSPAFELGSLSLFTTTVTITSQMPPSLSLSLSFSFSVSLPLSLSLSFSVSVSVSLFLSLYIYIYEFVSMYIHLSVCLHSHLSTYLFFCGEKRKNKIVQCDEFIMKESRRYNVLVFINHLQDFR